MHSSTFLDVIFFGQKTGRTSMQQCGIYYSSARRKRHSFTPAPNAMWMAPFLLRCAKQPPGTQRRVGSSGANCWVNERERGFTASSFDERRCAQSTQTLYRSFSFSLLLFHRIKKNATFVTSPFAVMQRDLALCSHSEQRLSYTNQTGILNIFLHICPRAIR